MMGMARQERQRGFSLLELAGALTLLAIAAAVLLGRLAYYEELAEKAKMEATIRAIRSAMQLRMATMMIEGRVQEYHLLATQNPIDWLDDKKPDDYRGAFSASDIARLPADGWYFDTTENALVYLLRNGRYFQHDRNGMKRVRIKIRPVFNRPAGPDPSTAGNTADAVRLELVEPYRWF
jgi:prepilin-type N-terminal cleavage/methylation domain-containing protein